MPKCNGHLSNKNFLSNFLKEVLLREESFNLAGINTSLWQSHHKGACTVHEQNIWSVLCQPRIQVFQVIFLSVNFCSIYFLYTVHNISSDHSNLVPSACVFHMTVPLQYYCTQSLSDCHADMQLMTHLNHEFTSWERFIWICWMTLRIWN